MELFFDTETSGLLNFKNPRAPKPWVVQLGMILSDENAKYLEFNCIIKANERTIDEGAEAVHNISVELSNKVGLSEVTVLKIFLGAVKLADTVVCHNVDFDKTVMLGLIPRTFQKELVTKPFFCTMKGTTNILKLPGRYGNYKWPSLNELNQFLFGENVVGAHDAMYDVTATRNCYYELKKRELI